MKRMILTAAAILAAQAAAAQEDVQVTVAETEEYGRFLTVNDKPVYLFTADTQGTEGTDPEVSCTGECLDAWPLVTTEGSARAGDGAMPDMVGTLDEEGRAIVTYNGWPLYHFARDTEGAPPTGQEIESFGGEWYLLAPDGVRIEGEGV